MKYFVIFLILIGLSGSLLFGNHAYGIYLAESPEELWEKSQLIFVGNITDVKVLEFEKSSTTHITLEDGTEQTVVENYTLSLDEYTVAVEEFVKNPLDLDVITVRQPTISLPGYLGAHVSFELGDRVLFYIKNLDGNNTYAPESFKIPKQCNTESVLEKSRTHRNGLTITQDGIQKDDNFTAGIPMKFVYDIDVNTLEGKSYDFDVGINRVIDKNNVEAVLSKKIHIEKNLCDWITSTEWEITPQEGKHTMTIHVAEDDGGGDALSTHFFVIQNISSEKIILSPLQQFSSGIKAEEIQCKTGLERTIKINDFDRFYCVSPDTKQILIKRGWAFDDSKACRNPIDCADSGISLDRTVYPPSELIVDANNQFALDFYSYVTKDKDENIFFSPTSISTAFAIAYEGAQGNTAKEMEEVFGFDPDDEQRRSEFANMQASLNPADQKFKLRLANALWLAQGFEPLVEYVDVARTYYDSKVDTVDFASDEAINTINGWVDTKTEGKIEKLFEQLDPNTQLVITNAIYFKGNWTFPFDKDRTRDANFMINPQKTVQVPTMSRDFTYNYTSNDQVQILELPYQGDRLSMLIFLPNEIDGLVSLENSLTVEKIEQWKSELSEQRLFIQIPKFKLETNYDLKASLPEIGMPSAFSISDADFSGITGSRGLYIEQAIHKAFVDVNEEGTEAAAATGIVMDQSMPPEFRADHPFMFLIQDNETGSILFMGRVAVPTLD